MFIENSDAVIFDMDGVIFDSEKVWQRADAEADTVFNTGFDSSVRISCCGRDERSVRAMLKNLKPDLDVDAYRDYIIDRVRQAEKSGAPLKDGFVELIENLKAENKKIALATSSSRERAENLFKTASLDMTELFDAAVFREDVKIAKPDPEIFLTAAKRMNVEPSRTAVLEDSINGITAAYVGNFIPIMVVDLIPPPSEFLLRGLTVVNSLIELISKP